VNRGNELAKVGTTDGMKPSGLEDEKLHVPPLDE
jgi:hypothetical protein